MSSCPRRWAAVRAAAAARPRARRHAGATRVTRGPAPAHRPAQRVSRYLHLRRPPGGRSLATAKATLAHAASAPSRRAPETLDEPQQPRHRLPGGRAARRRDRDLRAAARRPRADPRRRAPRHARAPATTSPTPTSDAGRTQDAIAIYEPLLADRERILGAEHPDTLTTRGNLADAYQAAGRTTTRSRSSSRCSPTASGSSAPSTPTRSPPAATSPTPTRPRGRADGRDRDLRAAARRPRADPRRRAPRHARQPRQPRQRLPGARGAPTTRSRSSSRCSPTSSGSSAPSTPTRSATRGNLANAYQAAGRADDAIAIFEPLLADRERILGAEHPDTLTTRGNLAGAYDAAGRTDDARRLRGAD